jgi:trigger factor
MKAFVAICSAFTFLSASVVSFSVSPNSHTFRPRQLQKQRQQRWSLPILSATSSSSAAAAEASSAPAEITVTRLPNSAVEIQIPVPGTATRAAYDKVSTELSKTLQIPGFRKGSKIPPQLLEQVMTAKGGKNAIKIQAINELITQLVEPTLKEQSIDPIGQATLSTSAEELANEYTPGEPLLLQVKCDVWPDIQWKTTSNDDKPYIGLKAKYSRKPFNQERLDMAVRDLKERYVTLEPIDDADHALQMGDACVVQMDGYMATASGEKGEPLPNAASGDRVEVVLGPGRYMEGLVEGLVGAKVGETVVVKVSFPEVSFKYR